MSMPWKKLIATSPVGILLSSLAHGREFPPHNKFRAECDEADDLSVRTKAHGQWNSWTRDWQMDWDGRDPEGSLENRKQVLKSKNIVKTTKHILLIRHGQYDLKSLYLTPLGQEQARITGKRLQQMTVKPIRDHYGQINVTFASIIHSNIERAKETAMIIAQEMPEVPLECDPMLAEGFPCVPQGDQQFSVSEVFEDSARIEAAFRKYIKRNADWKEEKEDDELQIVAPDSNIATTETKHEYVILVCHMNVIRYFVCRALQLPPEFWLRFRGDNCGITELIIYDDGKVSLAKFADVGHLASDQHTFH